jgi:hypothetical protein
VLHVIVGEACAAGGKRPQDFHFIGGSVFDKKIALPSISRHIDVLWHRFDSPIPLSVSSPCSYHLHFAKAAPMNGNIKHLLRQAPVRSPQVATASLALCLAVFHASTVYIGTEILDIGKKRCRE